MPLKPKVHVCLLYNTATANVTPALDPAFQPEEVILVHNAEQQYRADSLAAVLKPAGIKVTHWLVNDIWQLDSLRDRLLDLLVAREDDDLALNASGGTRPMNMAAYEIFREFGCPIFFVHPHTDEVNWLHDRTLPSFNVADRIKLPSFLRAHGAELGSIGARTGVKPPLRRLTDALIREAQDLAKPLSALNWLAQQAEGSLVSPELTDRQLRWDALTHLLSALENENILEFRRGRLYFPDEDARFFANGGWLESHVFGLIYGLRTRIPKIQDIGRSVEILRDSGGHAVKNELDVAFLCNNHLYIIECKTKRFQAKADPEQFDTHGADALYKLDTLKGLLGDVHTQPLLVSYQPLSTWDRQRAKDLGVQLCSADQLQRLGSWLEHWISIPVEAS